MPIDMERVNRFYERDTKGRQLIENNHLLAFHSKTLEVLKEVMPDIKGKKVCIPSSGDNKAVVAFAMMGADVTACDLSVNQLEYGRIWAKELGLDIKFLQNDTMKLANIEDEQYDLVYTSNGVHVWINDLDSMYSNISRILKKDGIYLMREIHPFTRPFEDNLLNIKVKKPYDDIGPYYEPNGYDGGFDTFHYRIEDIVNAICKNKLMLLKMKECKDEPHTSCFDKEFYPDIEITEDELYDWHKNKLYALPSWLVLCAKKIDNELSCV